MALGINLGILSQETSTDFQNIYSLDFDGVDDYVDCGTSLELKPNIITVSCWVKGSTQTAYTRIISQDGPTGGADAYGFYVTTALNKVVFAIKTDVTGTVTSATSGVVLDNSWHHLVGTYDGSEVILYVDGVAIGSPVAGTSILNYGIGGLTIGCFSEPTTLPDYLFNGNIDEVSIFDSVIPIGDLWDGSEKPTDLTSLSPVAWYRMGDNGAYKSPQWLIPNNENKDKISNYSLSFDGIDDYITISNNTSLGRTQNISYSVWVNLESLTNRQYIVGNWSSSNNGTGLSLETIGGNALVFQIGDGTNDSFFDSRVSNFSTLASQNTWTHILATWDGIDAKIYINGNLENTWSPTTPYTITNWSKFWIARRGNSGTLFLTNGLLAECSLFDTAISIGDVWDGSGKPKDVSGVSGITNYWRMGEDATFVYNVNPDGTWAIPDQVGSNDGTSNNQMADSARVGTAPSSSINSLSFNMDFEDRVTDVPT